MTRLVWLVLVVAACGKGDAEPATAAPPTEALTFYRDVTPLIDRYCLRCHDGRAP